MPSGISSASTTDKNAPTAAILDSQSVRTASQSGLRGYDAGKKITGQKRHILVNTMGNLLPVEVTPADVEDRDGARLLNKPLASRYGGWRMIWADGGYAGSPKEEVACLPPHRRIDLEIVKRSDRAKGCEVLPRHWIVKRTFTWLSQSRRLIHDHGVLMDHSKALIDLSMLRRMLARIAS